jgi:transposase
MASTQKQKTASRGSVAGSSNERLPGFPAFRRLARDYELLPSTEEAWIYLAMIRIMLRRLA